MRIGPLLGLLLGPLLALAPAAPVPRPAARLAVASHVPAVSDTSRFRDGYRLALAPYTFQFPRDHAAHPGYRTEWWYLTGQLEGRDAPHREYGFQLTLFRVGLDAAWRASHSAWAPRELVLGHGALTDVGAQRFYFDERLERAALGLAGADPSRLHVWVDDWSLIADSAVRVLHAHATLGARAGPRRGWDQEGFDLELAPLGPPVVHGASGVSQKSSGHGNASHYYSFTRLTGAGVVTRGGHREAVTGTAWLDHEFGTSQLASHQVGWDWFSIQLDDGRDLMLYHLRLRGGGIEPLSQGTLVEPGGRIRHLAIADLELTPLTTWVSPRTGGRYPARWRVRVPSAGIDLAVAPRVADQELVTTLSGGVAYWEGAVLVEGRSAGRPVRGRGYVELTGYAGAPLSF
jgi:predicted secreted hydrolase